jgi:hypothetical protein
MDRAPATAGAAALCGWLASHGAGAGRAGAESARTEAARTEAARTESAGAAGENVVPPACAERHHEAPEPARLLPQYEEQPNQSYANRYRGAHYRANTAPGLAQPADDQSRATQVPSPGDPCCRSLPWRPPNTRGTLRSPGADAKDFLTPTTSSSPCQCPSHASPGCVTTHCRPCAAAARRGTWCRARARSRPRCGRDGVRRCRG